MHRLISARRRSPAASLISIEPAFAHGYAGPHMFISTLLIDDPNVADEASLPTFTFLPQPTDGGPVLRASTRWSSNSTNASPRTSAFPSHDGYQWLRTPGAKTANGWQNLEAGLNTKSM